MYASGVTSSAAVMSEGRTESVKAERTVQIADCVKGGVIVRRESFVVCDFRAVEEFERRDRESWVCGCCCCCCCCSAVFGVEVGG